MIKIIFLNDKKFPVTKISISRLANTFFKYYKKKIDGEIEVMITDNRTIKSLNRIWRGKDEVTDVLSFVMSKDKLFKTDSLGQIVISYPKIITQAKEYNVSVKEEFSRMFVHGLLHIVGFEHSTEAKAKKMFKIQEEILAE